MIRKANILRKSAVVSHFLINFSVSRKKVVHRMAFMIVHMSEIQLKPLHSVSLTFEYCDVHVGYFSCDSLSCFVWMIFSTISEKLSLTSHDVYIWSTSVINFPVFQPPCHKTFRMASRTKPRISIFCCYHVIHGGSTIATQQILFESHRMLTFMVHFFSPYHWHSLSRSLQTKEKNQRAVSMNHA